MTQFVYQTPSEKCLRHKRKSASHCWFIEWPGADSMGRRLFQKFVRAGRDGRP